MSGRVTTYDTYDKVNRLIIIGNGFDLAHGMKTSFKDFIYNYLRQSLYQLYIRQYFKDNLISIAIKNRTYYKADAINNLTVSQLVSLYFEILADQNFKITYTSKLLNSILENLSMKNWVDIELEYFELLRSHFKLNESKEIEKLNEDLEFLKNSLTEYLKSEQESITINPDQNLLNQFQENIKYSEVKSKTITSDLLPDKYCILNFNYTETAEKYCDSLKNNSIEYIPIHGELIGDDITKQKPVFGFGDELDADYINFENQKNDALFKHIKSFKYLQFKHYKNLLDFIEYGPYQIHIYGHSCGLSDRTLLNTIFEHENCISIKPFYYQNNGKDDYEEKSYAIARNFKSKAELRARVVNKQYCSPMMQPQKPK